MAINVPELESLPLDQRQSVLEEAIRNVNATQGKMPNTAHYVGCGLSAAVALVLEFMGKGLVIVMLVGVPMYMGSLAVGIVLWRRSMARELRKVVSRILAARLEA
jgi:hypothetical protein